MSENEKVKAVEASLQADLGKVHEAFDVLSEEVRTILANMVFRIKQTLHFSNHDPVDAHAEVASDALAQAISTARLDTTVNALISNKEKIAPGPADIRADMIKPETPAMTAQSSGLASGAVALEKITEQQTTDAEKRAAAAQQTPPVEEKKADDAGKQEGA